MLEMSAEFFQEEVSEKLAEFEENWGHEVSCAREELRVIDGYIGPGYAVPYPEELQTIQLVARTEGVILDQVYTGKAFHGLLDRIRKGDFKKGERILFCHTGGVFGLFDKPEQFAFVND